MSLPIILRIYRNNQLIGVKQFDQSQIVIGSGADSDVLLSAENVLPMHCLIERRGDYFILVDLGTDQGIQVEEKTVLEHAIQNNDQVRVGDFTLRFFVGTRAPIIVTPEKEPAPPVKMEARPETRPEPRPEPRVEPLAALKPSSVKRRETQDDLRSLIRPGRGGQVEVLVAWGDRVLYTYHYQSKRIYQTGRLGHAPIFIPSSVVPTGWPLLDLRNESLVNLPVGSSVVVVNEEKSLSHEELERRGSIQGGLDRSLFRLQQGEVAFVYLSGSSVVLIFRHVTVSRKPSLSTPFILSTDEWLGFVGSAVLMMVFMLYVMAHAPKDEIALEPQEETRIARIIVDVPRPAPVPKDETPQVAQAEPPRPQPPPVPEKVKMGERSQLPQDKGEKGRPGKKSIPKLANQAAPKPFKDLPKKYTSVKQGGGVKTTSKEGGNASTQVDPKKFGLFSALGSGGVREELDTAYRGSGEIIGMGEQATGTAGFAADRAGKDLGSRISDRGAGGMGIATHGIKDVGTRGKSSGDSEYGSSHGLGEKSRVQIVAGGAEESFAGTIDKEAVRRVIRENIREIQSCYERGLNKMPKGTRLEGRVMIRWVIVEKGKAQEVGVKESTLKNRNIENCIRDRIASWSYPEPPPGLEGVVEFPFYLKPSN